MYEQLRGKPHAVALAEMEKRGQKQMKGNQGVSLRRGKPIGSKTRVVQENERKKRPVALGFRGHWRQQIWWPRDMRKQKSQK